MKQNLGTTDRVLRILIGSVLVGAVIFGQAGAWGWLGIVLVLSGIIRFCPFYHFVHFNTCDR